MKYVMDSVEEADFIDFFRRHGHQVSCSYTYQFYNSSSSSSSDQGYYFEVSAECAVGSWWHKDTFVGRAIRKSRKEATIAALTILCEALHLTKTWEDEKQREEIADDL